MGRFATFDAVSLLHRSGPASVWSARSVVGQGGPAEHCLKRVDGTAADATAAEQLLAGASVQQAMAFQSRGWAAVRAMGAAGHGAFCVTDRFPRSAQTIIDGPRRLCSAELRTIFVAVLDALIELQVAYGRPHANLKPSNVLIGPRLRPGQICLTDPCPTGQTVASLSKAPDPKALGRLLFALVTHRPHTAAGWPMKFDEPWRRLGGCGRQWFDLCRSLVHPLGDAAPDLDELMTQVVAIAPGGRRLGRGGRRVATAASLAAALAVAAVAERHAIPRWYATAQRQAMALVRGNRKPFQPAPSAAPPPRHRWDPWTPPRVPAAASAAIVVRPDPRAVPSHHG